MPPTRSELKWTKDRAAMMPMATNPATIWLLVTVDVSMPMARAEAP